MSYTAVGSCPKCGAPIYSQAIWGGITPPPVTYSCVCAVPPLEQVAKLQTAFPVPSQAFAKTLFELSERITNLEQQLAWHERAVERLLMERDA